MSLITKSKNKMGSLFNSRLGDSVAVHAAPGIPHSDGTPAGDGSDYATASPTIALAVVPAHRIALPNSPWAQPGQRCTPATPYEARKLSK